MQLISISNILYDLKFVYIALVPVPVFFPKNRVLNKQVNIIEGRLNLNKLPKFYTHLLIFHLLICGNILYDILLIIVNNLYKACEDIYFELTS